MKRISLDELDLSINKKQKSLFRLDLFDLIDGSNISLPVAVIGKGKGSQVTIVAAQHGNEWNGSFACHLLYQLLDPAKMKGKVVMLPIANPPAFTQRARVSNLDYIDMNRTFGFVKKRKPTEHLAKIIFEKFCLTADYVLDLHSGGPGEYIPIVEVIDYENIELAKSLNLKNILIRKKDSGSLVPNCEKLVVKAFSIEAGRALKLNYDYAESLAKGIINFLKTLGVIDESPATIEEQNVYTGKIILPSEKSGFFKSKVKLLDKVEKGQPICTVWPFFESEPQEIVSPVKGTIIYLRSDEVISQGDSICHIAE